ncbi:MAG: response regulator, partial [Chloroflexi bacterium]|nr:response regulator [Chloroflexota bacterium]
MTVEQKIRVLIIDDDQFTRQVLSKILQRDKAISAYKPSIIEASNGMEGLRLFEAHKPVLAIVDLLMPKMDGFEVCKRLREIAGPEKLAIAVTSGVYKDAAISRRIRDEFQA